MSEPSGTRLVCGFLTPRDLAARLQVSPRQIDRLIAERGFPRPVYLSRSVRYAELLKSGHDRGPVALFELPEYSKKVLVDGVHRMGAHIINGDSQVPARIYRGGFHQAVFMAAAANSKHRHPLTPKERKRQIEMTTAIPEFANRPDSWFAKELKVSDKTVNKHRKRRQAAPS